MKKLFLLTVLIAFTGICYGQEAFTGNVTLEMRDGTSVRGWIFKEFTNAPKYVEISDGPEGEKVRYANNLINRVVFDAGPVYVVKDVVPQYRKKTSGGDVLLKEEYMGDGISMYSTILTSHEYSGTTRNEKIEIEYYLQIGDDIPVFVSTGYRKGGAMTQASGNRKKLARYFSERYPQYTTLAARIESKRIYVKDSPLEVVKEWEEMYAGK